MKFHALIIFAFALLSAEAAEPKMIPFEQIRAKWSALPFSAVEAAANRGDVTAQHYLARVNMEGIGRPRNAKTAVQWYEKAVSQDFPNSQLNLGIYLYWGDDDTPADPKRGLQLLRKAAETGEPLALNAFAKALENEGNPAEAAEKFQKSAAAGNTVAMRSLADMHVYGIIERDYEKAYSWLKKAAIAGDVEAMATLSEFLTSNYQGFKARPEEAEQWRQKALAKGYRFGPPPERISSVTNHFTRRLFGPPDPNVLQAQKLEQGSEADRRRAFSLYLQNADDDPEAAFKVAQAYESGEFTQRDLRKALDYYTRSFDFRANTWARAEEAMIRILESGPEMHTPENNLPVFQAIQSHGYQRPPALAYRIGRQYDEGKTVAADLTKAVKYYREAARGSAEARNRLGELWLEGVDGKSDPEEAAKWFRSAAQAGYAPAQKNLERLNTK